MKSEYIQLGEVISKVIDYRGKTPKKLGGDWAETGKRVISAKNVHAGKLDNLGSIRYVSNDIYSKWMKDEVHRNDIFLSSEGASMGESMLWESDEKIVLGQRLFCLRCNEKIMNPYFLAMYMQTSEYRTELYNHATGTSVLGLRQPTLLKTKIRYLPIKVQNIIGELYHLINDKIVVNESINKNLEQQAQAIYSSIFIERPNPQWKIGQLSDLVTVKYGKDHKKLVDGIYPVYGSGGIMRYVEQSLYSGESVLIPRKGTLNNVTYVNGAFWSVDTMFYTEMLRPNVAKFVYHFVKNKDLALLNAGSAVPSMTTNILNAMQLPIPDDETLSRFEDIVSPMYEIMQENDKQSSNLALVRDTLLPKLMSGELDVSDLDL